MSPAGLFAAAGSRALSKQNRHRTLQQTVKPEWVFHTEYEASPCSRSGAGVLAWLAIAGILILFTLALTWLAVIAGLSATTVDGASAFSYPLIFLPFISSAFVATATMPGPVRAFAENQPVTPIVNTIRDLYAQQPISTDIWIALAWCAGILIVAYALAMATYHRKIA